MGRATIPPGLQSAVHLQDLWLRTARTDERRTTPATRDAAESGPPGGRGRAVVGLLAMTDRIAYKREQEIG